MTLLDIERLIRKISDLLAQNGNAEAAPRLAEDYATACHAANLRLQQCESMIRADDRQQAIQLAETAPNLLQLISLLEFRNAVVWRDFCQHNGLPVAEQIDPRAVQALNQCYAQGINTDHPLYAIYRKAVLHRDDEAALDALRSIARLNPSDANAAAELARVDAKVLAARLEHLGELLTRGDAAQIVGEVESIESFGFKSRPGGETWNRGQQIRCSALLQEAAQCQFASQWASALTKIELIRRLQKELELEFSAGELQKLSQLEKWTAEEKEKDRQNREFAKQLSELHRRIRQSEEKDTSTRYVELPELRADFEALHKVWRALTDFTRPIPEEASLAFRKRSSLLEGEIARRMAVRRRTILSGVAAAVLVGTVMIWIVLAHVKAQQCARQLQSAMSQRQTRVAEQLLTNAETKRLSRSANVSAAMAETESFLAREHGLLTNFNTAFAELPARPGGEPTIENINAIAGRLTQARDALNALSPDLKAENEPRLNAFEQQWQQFLSDAAVKVNGFLEEWISDAEKQSAHLDYRSPLETTESRLGALSRELQKVDAYEAGFTNQVALRSDLLERAATVQARFEAFQNELKKLDHGLAALKRARSFSDYSSAIHSMASSEFSSAPAATAANAAQSLNTSAEMVLRTLLNATNPATWAFINKTKEPNLTPELVMPVERSEFQQLEGDPAVNAAHLRYRFFMARDGIQPVEWITAGTLDSSGGWKQIKAWTVESNAANAVFEDNTYGFFGGQWRLSPTEPVRRLDETNTDETAAFAAAGLEKVWAGGDIYTGPLLGALDAVKNSDEGSPVFRAYLFCKLVEVMGFQPDAWGLSFCPAARADAAQIQHIVGGKITSGDWFVPWKANDWNPPLKQFFASRKSLSYLQMAQGNLALARAVARDGLHYAGFADLNGKPVTSSDPAPGQVWGYTAAGAEPTLISSSAMPLSPLFALPVPRADYLARVGVDPNSPTFAANLLPLFRSKK